MGIVPFVLRTLALDSRQYLILEGSRPLRTISIVNLEAASLFKQLSLVADLLLMLLLLLESLRLLVPVVAFLEASERQPNAIIKRNLLVHLHSGSVERLSPSVRYGRVTHVRKVLGQANQVGAANHALHDILAVHFEVFLDVCGAAALHDAYERFDVRYALRRREA